MNTFTKDHVAEVWQCARQMESMTGCKFSVGYSFHYSGGEELIDFICLRAYKESGEETDLARLLIHTEDDGRILGTATFRNMGQREIGMFERKYPSCSVSYGDAVFVDYSPLNIDPISGFMEDFKNISGVSMREIAELRGMDEGAFNQWVRSL